MGADALRKASEIAILNANYMAKKLQELSMQFQQMQRKYLADVQAQKSGKDAGGREAKFGLMDEDAAGGGGGEGGIGFTTQQLAVVDDLQEAVQSRDKEIVGIAKSIEELGAIFKDCSFHHMDARASAYPAIAC
mgnify:CR=1 FL=1